MRTDPFRPVAQESRIRTLRIASPSHRAPSATQMEPAVRTYGSGSTGGGPFDTHFDSFESGKLHPPGNGGLAITIQSRKAPTPRTKQGRATRSTLRTGDLWKIRPTRLRSTSHETTARTDPIRPLGKACCNSPIHLPAYPRYNPLGGIGSQTRTSLRAKRNLRPRQSRRPDRLPCRLSSSRQRTTHSRGPTTGR